MGTIIGIILIAIFIGIPVLFLGLILVSDVMSAVEYVNAYKGKGLIRNQIEDIKHRDYGGMKVIGSGRYRRYFQYEVEYEVNGKICSGIWQTKEKGLQVGQWIEIRYHINEKSGKPELSSVMYKDRVVSLGIGVIGAIILMIIFALTGVFS